MEVLGELKDSFQFIRRAYLPHLSRHPLYKGMTWEPTWKSVPMQDNHLLRLGFTVDPVIDRARRKFIKFQNRFCNLKHELAAFVYNINKIHSLPDGFFSPGILWYPRVLYPGDTAYNTSSAIAELDYYERSVGPQFSTLAPAYVHFPMACGRLAQAIEGSGKRRIFAISNYVKQRLLYPVHKWAMGVLASIPTDGTFDQLRPLHALRAKGCNECYSFDLKSATDRWPLSVIYTVMCLIWGDVMASSIVNSSLGLNTFLVGPPLTKRWSEVSFICGQPLGFYGSWSLFALSHHFIVWLAARKAYPDRETPFNDYALLGDDIVITDGAVAREYSLLLSRLSVSISLPKSIISRRGCLEFAKRFWCHSLKVDLSPVSLRAIWGARTLVGITRLAHHYNLTDFNALCRLAGAGYRVRARLSARVLTKRWARLRVISELPTASDDYPLEFRLGRKLPINPYFRAVILRRLLVALKPRELQLPPSELLFDGEREILERTVIRNWCESWLRWVLWYHKLLMTIDTVSIDEVLKSAPICARSWKRSEFDPNVFKFGILWRLYDLGEDWTISTVPRNLFPVMAESRWIRGGFSGFDFLLARDD